VENERADTPQARRVGAAAILLAASVLLSRLLGYGREALLAYRVGAGPESDAYYAAFQIPDLLNYLLAGGALSIAFVPLYTRYLASDDQRKADHLLATVLGTLTAAAVVATAILWWHAEPLIALQFPRFDADTQRLTTRLTRIVLPAQVLFVAGGIINATLLARGRFGAAAAAPLLYNGGIIAGGLFLAPLFPDPVEGFSWGALGGAALGPFLAPWLDARKRVTLRLRFAPTDRIFLSYMLIAAPLMFGQTLLTVDEWYERWFGALLEPGTVAHLSYARRMMLVPVAVVGQAIAAAALPALSRLWAEKKTSELNDLVLGTLQTGMALAAFAAGAFFLLSRDIVSIVYERGAFTATDAQAVAAILSLLCLAVPAWIAQQIASRAFYARADTWRPMILGTVVAVAAIPLYLALGRRFGALGLAAAPSIAMSINAIALLLLARRLHGAPDLRGLFGTTARSALVAVLAIAVASFTIDPAASGPAARLTNLLIGSLAYATALVGGTRFLGNRAMRSALEHIARRALRLRRAS
jgi:putative peptidoglycan lipid II flippase